MNECALCGGEGATSYISGVGYVHDEHLDEEPFRQSTIDRMVLRQMTMQVGD